MQHMHPLSPAGGTLMQEGGAHFDSARETKRGTPGTGVAKPRQRASVGSSTVDWAPLAQSKRIYPDETKDDPFAVFPWLANPALPPSFFATTSTHVPPAPVVLTAASMIPAAKAMPAVAHAKTHAQTAVALDMQTGVGTKRRASDMGGGGTSMSAAKKSKSSGGKKSGGGGGLGGKLGSKAEIIMSWLMENPASKAYFNRPVDPLADGSTRARALSLSLSYTQTETLTNTHQPAERVPFFTFCMLRSHPVPP